jgi:hypothetical protein
MIGRPAKINFPTWPSSQLGTALAQWLHKKDGKKAENAFTVWSGEVPGFSIGWLIKEQAVRHLSGNHF